MEIIVTDGYTLNPGDLSWKEIEALGNLTLYDRTSVELIAERCAQAEIIITNKTPIHKETIEKAPHLKMIAVTATGYNNIDIATASENNIIVSNVPAYGTASVAQHVFALLLELTNHTCLHSQSTAKGEWQKAKDWCYTFLPLTELSGKTMGIVGLGHIGQQVAKIALAFDMRVLYYNPNPKEYNGAKAANLPQLFANADIVSLHCPLKPDNKEFVNKDLLHLMKPTAYIINTARGQLVNENDLAEALNRGTIAGAALDVLSTEPPGETNPLLKAKNCVITPHIAWMSKEARQRIMNMTTENIKAFLKGNPVNVVSK
jgi:glycerate dehydrogenase